jgi:hypothetical protein
VRWQRVVLGGVRQPTAVGLRGAAVARAGAGKNTIMSALFEGCSKMARRLLEAREGAIAIDADEVRPPARQHASLSCASTPRRLIPTPRAGRPSRDRPARPGGSPPPRPPPPPEEPPADLALAGL